MSYVILNDNRSASLPPADCPEVFFGEVTLTVCRQTVQVREREIGPKPGMWETSGWGSVGWPATGNDTERGSGGTNTSCPPILTRAEPVISQSTNRSTKCDVLYDLRVLRQPPRTCKSLKSLSRADSHGGSHRFESCSAHHIFQGLTGNLPQKPNPQNAPHWPPPRATIQYRDGRQLLLFYIKNVSIGLDITILFDTIKILAL